MRQDKLSKQNVILYLCGIIPVVWLGLLIAPCLEHEFLLYSEEELEELLDEKEKKDNEET